MSRAFAAGCHNDPVMGATATALRGRDCTSCRPEVVDEPSSSHTVTQSRDRGTRNRVAFVLSRAFAAVLVLAIAPLARGADSPDLTAIAKKYGLEIVTNTPKFPVEMRTGAIDGAAASKKDMDSYAAIFAVEWSLYPRELIERTRLKRIVFCKDLSFAKQLRTAVPDFEHDTLYLDVARGRDDDTYVRKVIHHEFFHIIDLRDDGKLYEDERWSKLNPPGFKYGKGGAELQNDPTVTTTGRDAPGFLNRYAASGVEEDKAEVFAHMIVEPRAMADRAKMDKYMRAKMERMKELLADFTPKADRAFWTRVEKARRDVKQKD